MPEAIAIAVFTEFFGMERVRNPSQKPLNVLSMVGRSRVRAITEAINSAGGSETSASGDEQEHVP